MINFTLLKYALNDIYFFIFFMGLIRFIFSKVFLIHLAILTAIGVFIIIGVNYWLKYYTDHGKYIAVPEFIGLQYYEIDDYANLRDLVPVIIDSVYDNNRVKGSVIGQEPPAGQLVKKNRKIYLTIVAMSSEMVRMPDLRDLTLRQAIATLDMFGLKAGKLKYEPHIALNTVLRQEFKGVQIEPYTMIEKGSTIQLVLGRGLKNEKTQIPFLIGKTRTEAYNIIQASALNVGTEFFEKGATEDKAFVVKQRPIFSSNAFVDFGTPIDLWFNPQLEDDIHIIQQMLLQEESQYEETQ